MKKKIIMQLDNPQLDEQLAQEEIETIRFVTDKVNNLFDGKSATVVFSSIASLLTQAVCTLCESREEAVDVINGLSSHIVSSIGLAEAAGVCNWRDKDSTLQ